MGGVVKFVELDSTTLVYETLVCKLFQILVKVNKGLALTMNFGFNYIVWSLGLEP